MVAQLPLSFRLKRGHSLEEFVPGKNLQAVDALQALLSDGADTQLFLSGPPGSGKTHLLMGLCERADHDGIRCVYLPLRELTAFSPDLLEDLGRSELLAVDDVDAIAGIPSWEEALFVLFNQARDLGNRLVFTASRGPASLPLGLPDLKSRLGWGVSYALHPLDDQDKLDLLLQQADKRGLVLPQEAARYLLTRCRRDTRTLLQTLDQLDRASLAAQRKLTLPFVRNQLRESQSGPD